MFSISDVKLFFMLDILCFWSALCYWSCGVSSLGFC